MSEILLYYYMKGSVRDTTLLLHEGKCQRYYFITTRREVPEILLYYNKRGSVRDTTLLLEEGKCPRYYFITT